MPRDAKETETARQRRAVFAVLGLLSILAIVFFGTRGDDDAGPGGYFADRETREGELPDGAPRHRPRHRDGGIDVEGDAAILAHHEVLPEQSDPQLPGPESDPGTYDPGPGEEFIERYQGRSGRLSPEANIHGTRTSIPTRSRMAAPIVVAFTPSTIVSPGDNVVIHAVVHGRHSEDLTPDTIMVTVVNGSDPSTGTPMPMVLGDSEYTYTYVAAAEAHPIGQDGAPPMASFIVRATGTYEGESYSRACTGTFNVHSPGAHLDTDRASAQRRGSDVVVTVPVMIDRPGAYFGLAELWGGADGASPVAFGRDRVIYDQVGEQTFTFLFGGAVIQASGIDGPYVVRNVRFMQVDSIPPHQQSPTEELLTTPAWSASEFH